MKEKLIKEAYKTKFNIAHALLDKTEDILDEWITLLLLKNKKDVILQDDSNLEYKEIY